MSSELTLEVDGASPILSPSWTEVESVLAALGPAGPGFVTLSHPEAGYVQAAGARLRLIVEFREVRESNSFTHYVLGKSPLDSQLTSINTNAGIIQLARSEVLGANLAKDIFRCFFDKQTVPPQYTRRDVTAMFKKKAQ